MLGNTREVTGLLTPPGPATFFMALSCSLCGQVQTGSGSRLLFQTTADCEQNGQGEEAPQIPDVSLTHALLSILPSDTFPRGSNLETQATSCHLASRSLSWTLVRCHRLIFF